MPIGDLLAEITGEPSSSHTQAVTREPYLPKLNPEVRTKSIHATTSTTASATRNVDLPTSSTRLNASNPRINSKQDASSLPLKKAPLSMKSQAIASLPSGPPKPPKKGSYAEIMARGKAVHATLGQMGKIMHKNTEKPPSKREREEMKVQMSIKAQKTLTQNGKSLKTRPIKGRDAGKIVTEPPKKISKAALATTGYTGTARPKPTSNLKSARLSASSNSQKYRNERRGFSGSGNRYRSDEDDEDEEEEEEENYESDLSDMEAAAFEVDEEEETAAKIARREDAEALAEENRLKREKEAKRKRLAAMAKSRSGR